MFDLTGHILNKGELNLEEQTLSITIDNDKVFLLKVEGDCCSHGKFLAESWHAFDLPQKIKRIDYPRIESFLGGEYKVYEEIWTLENGDRLAILYDNKSNEYYGSSLEVYYNEKKDRRIPK